MGKLNFLGTSIILIYIYIHLIREKLKGLSKQVLILREMGKESKTEDTEKSYIPETTNISERLERERDRGS